MVKASSRHIGLAGKLLLMASGGLALAQATAAQGLPGDHVLTGEQIRAALVGNTITGVENGRPYEEYLNPNGTIVGRDASGRYSGEWRIVGSRMCFHYVPDEGEAKDKGWDCNAVILAGSRITWSDDEKDPPEAVLLEGNPKKL